MGSSSSKKKVPKVGVSSSTTFADASQSNRTDSHKNDKTSVNAGGKSKLSADSKPSGNEVSFVFKRKGSMYLDEEGTVAHEFYEEVIPSDPGAKPYMRRQVTNLTPQGDVDYVYPRLSGDCDIILCDP